MNTNPIFTKVAKKQETEIFKEQATYKGVITKTLALFGVLLLSSIGSLFLMGLQPTVYITLLVISMFVGFIAVWVASSSPKRAKTWSFVYAVAEGFTIGFITLLFALSFSDFNIVGLAMLITLGIFGGMLVLYMTKLIQVTNRFRKVMLGVSLGILVSMLFVGIISIFDRGAMWYLLFGNPYSPIVLLLTLVFILYGSFMLVMSFDNAKQIVEGGASKDYEYMVGLGLIVSTIYIYLQVLRLLAIILSRRD